MTQMSGPRSILAEVETLVAPYYEQALAPDYPDFLRGLMAVFYTLTQRADPRYQFQPRLPCIWHGQLSNGRPKVVIAGLNPRGVLPTRPQPTSMAQYVGEMNRALALPRLVSRFHEVELSLLAGIDPALAPALDVWREHLFHFDVVPWYSPKWGVARLTAPRVEIISDHFGVIERLLALNPIQLLILNGKNWHDLLVHNPNGPCLDRTFDLLDRFTYVAPPSTRRVNGAVVVKPKAYQGEIIIGRLTLTGQPAPVPTIILTRFIHQNWPPFRSEELSDLGRAIRERLDRLSLLTRPLLG